MPGVADNDEDGDNLPDNLTPEQAAERARIQEFSVRPRHKPKRSPNFPHTVRTDKELLTMRAETVNGLPVSFCKIAFYLGCTERTARGGVTRKNKSIKVGTQLHCFQPGNR